MKQIIYKFFSWMKDHFSLLFSVFIRLHIGEKKKETSIRPAQVDFNYEEVDETEQWNLDKEDK